MNSTPRYDIYRGAQILSSLLLIASIVTHTFWACAVAGLVLLATAIVDYCLITDFHAGLKAKDDILNDYVDRVTHLKAVNNTVMRENDILIENAEDIIDDISKRLSLSDEEKKSLYKELYKNTSPEDN